MTLGTLGRPEEELAVYDQAVARFGEATEPALREAVGRARKAAEGTTATDDRFLLFL